MNMVSRNNNVRPVMLDPNPTPEERADFVVKQLEYYIREGRNNSLGGMSFVEWQDLARKEIAETVEDAERKVGNSDRYVTRLIVTAAATLVTIGFWGAAVSVNSTYELVGSIIMFIAGLALFAVTLELAGRTVGRRIRARGRRKAWGRVEELDSRIKKMQRRMDKKAKEVEKELEKIFGKRGTE